jgi:RHS repeat-associated protein
MTTWLFEEGTFVPAAKLTKTEKLSIVTNYMGTPEAMYREDGEAVWTCELNSYGKVRNFQGGSKTDCPFRYQGQYEDAETGLYYNRFRYYSPEEGVYISQDPIGMNGGINLYSYVNDTNSWVDWFGLAPTLCGSEDGKPEKTQWGWTGTKKWNKLVDIVKGGGTIEELSGKVPTRNEAIRLIEEGGGKINRIDSAHQPPNPHNYNHINYTTISKEKGTIKIQSL